MTDWTGKPFSEHEKTVEMSKHQRDILKASLLKLQAYTVILRQINFQFKNREDKPSGDSDHS